MHDNGQEGGMEAKLKMSLGDLRRLTSKNVFFMMNHTHTHILTGNRGANNHSTQPVPTEGTHRDAATHWNALKESRRISLQLLIGTGQNTIVRMAVSEIAGCISALSLQNAEPFAGELKS